MRVLQLTTTPRAFFEQQVAALEARGVDCTVLPVPGSHGGEDEERSPAQYARYYPEVVSALRGGEYDIVHANFGLVAPFALAQAGRPVVLTFWGSDLMGPDWLNRLSRTSARLADAVVLPSPVLGDYLGQSYDYVPFGVDTDRFRPVDREEARERVGWDADARKVLFPYDPDRTVKDHERAARLVAAADPDADLAVLQGVDHDEVPLYMNASDAVLVSSRRESGPMVVREAAACNVPVVSTDVGFARRTLAGVEHCTVSDDDADLVAGLEAVLETPRRSDGRAQVETLDVAETGERLHGVYRRVLGGTAA